MTQDNDLLCSWKRDPHYRLLQAEMVALDDRLERDSELGKVVRALWEKHAPLQGAGGDQHLAFYRKVLAQMLLGKFERIVTPDPVTDTDSIGAGLAQMNVMLDHKFAEVRAISELARDMGGGLFIGDVMDHIFETFRAIIPYDQIGLALIEYGDGGRRTMRAIWSRCLGSTRGEGGSIPYGYAVNLETSVLIDAADSEQPRIIDDLRALDDGPLRAADVRIALKGDARSVMACPLVGREGLFGMMFFSSPEPCAYTEDHANLFEAVAQTLTGTLTKCHLYEELTVRNQFIRTVFGRYLSNDIADALLENPGALEMGGRTCTVTVLMSDLRGFTKMSEHMKPEQVVTTLNAYFNSMVRVIHGHNGTIDNIIGDAIMVLFGAPIARKDDALRAVRCALDMQAAMDEVNRNNASMGLPDLSMGIGINTGDVVAGNIGSMAHAKYSVIGASVNLAARLEANAAAGEVLLSPTTFVSVRDFVTVNEERKVQAKGFSSPVAAYSIS